MTKRDETVPNLTEADWDAADRVLENPLRDEVGSDARRRLAEQHAVDPKGFRAKYRLPRRDDVVKEWLVDLCCEGGTEEEFRRRILERPIDEDLLQTYFDGIEALLESYSRFLQTIGAIVMDQRNPERWIEDEPLVDELAEKMSGKLPLFTVQIERIGELIAEARVVRGLRTIVLRDSHSAAASLLAFSTTGSAAQLWEKCREIAERSRTDPAYLYATTASDLFYKTHMPSLPRPNELLSLLYEECMATKLLVRERTPAPTPGREVPDAPTLNEDTGLRPEATAADASKARTPTLKHWAVGLEFPGRWWLFHRTRGRWQQRSLVAIPNENPSRLLEALAKEGGCLSRAEATALFASRYRGAPLAQLSKVTTDGLAKAKKAIRAAIAQAGEFALNDVPNPIPFVEPGWRAVIEIGYAIADDDDRLRFRTADTLHGAA